MARKPESTFYQSIHRLMPRKLHKEKMNNPFSSGTADVWYSGNKGDMWVEYKYISVPPKNAEMFVHKELSGPQKLWLGDRYREGRTVIVVLGTPLGAWIYKDLEWETVGVTANTIAASGYSKQGIADYIAERTIV